MVLSFNTAITAESLNRDIISTVVHVKRIATWGTLWFSRLMSINITRKKINATLVILVTIKRQHSFYWFKETESEILGGKLLALQLLPFKSRIQNRLIKIDEINIWICLSTWYKIQKRETEHPESSYWPRVSDTHSELNSLMATGRGSWWDQSSSECGWPPRHGVDGSHCPRGHVT